MLVVYIIIFFLICAIFAGIYNAFNIEEETVDKKPVKSCCKECTIENTRTIIPEIDEE